MATVSLAALLSLMLVGVGSVVAKTPGWEFHDAFNGGSLVTKDAPFIGSPATVSPGKYVAFNVTLNNGGKSNISAAYLSTDYKDDDPLGFPAYVGDAVWSGQTGPIRPCDPYLDAKLDCVLGDINAGASVTILIVFTASESIGPKTFNFLATGNGNTPSDGGTSHGDFLKGPARYVVSDNSEFAAGFVLQNGASFSTTGSLSRSNPQNTTLESFEQYQAATIEDGVSISGTDPCATSNCIGQWTRLTAANPFGGLFKVTLLIYGKNIPGSVDPEDIVLYHLGGTDLERGDDGIIGDEASERCASASDSASAPCIYVTEEGTNFQIVGWLLHNGSLHGSY